MNCQLFTGVAVLFAPASDDVLTWSHAADEAAVDAAMIQSLEGTFVVSPVNAPESTAWLPVVYHPLHRPGTGVHFRPVP
jgi:hypothetical protein